MNAVVAAARIAAAASFLYNTGKSECSAARLAH